MRLNGKSVTVSFTYESERQARLLQKSEIEPMAGHPDGAPDGILTQCGTSRQINAQTRGTMYTSGGPTISPRPDTMAQSPSREQQRLEALG